MVNDAKSFGREIRRRRKELGYTQAFIADFSGFSVSFISDLENGKTDSYPKDAAIIHSIVKLLR